MRLSFEKRLIVVFILIVAAISVIGIIIYRNNNTYRDDNNIVAHTQVVLYQSEEVLSLIKDIDAGGRGYILTQDSSFLQPYIVARNSVYKNIDSLRHLTKDNPVQQKRVDSLKILTKSRIDLAEFVLNLGQSTNSNKLIRIESFHKGKIIMDDMRRIIQQVQQNENELLAYRQARNSRSITRLNITFYALIYGILLLFIATFFILRYNLRLRSNQQKALALFNKELEEKVKQRTEELSNSEKLFRALIENSGDAIATLDKDGIIKYQSPSTERIFGFPIKEMVGSNIVETIHPEDLPAMTKVMERAIQFPGIAQHSIHRIKHKDGRWLWSEGSITNMLHNPSIDAFVVNFRDISERKAAEDKVHESEQRFRSIIEQYPNPVITYDKEGQVTGVNKAWEKMWQDTFENNKDYNIRKDPQMIASGLSFHVEKAYSGEPSTSEVYMYDPAVIGKQGRKRWIQMIAYPLMNVHHEVQEVIVILQDLTARREAEEKIEQSERRFRTLIQNSVEGLSILGEDGSVLEVSPSGKRILGYTGNELISTGERPDLIHPDDLIKFQKAFRHVLTHKDHIENIEYRFKTGNGSYKWIESSFNNQIHEPAIQGVVVNYRDISQRKATEELIGANEEKRRLIMNAALDAIICIDIDGLITFWNPQAEKVFGWQEAEVLGEKLSQIIIPQTFRHMHDRGMKNYLKTGNGPALNVLLELTAINKLNKEFPVELTVLPIKQGTEEFFCAFIRDISQRKQSETLLKKFNQQLLSAQQIAGLGYFERNLNTQEQYLSDEMYNICGIKKSDGNFTIDEFIKFVHPGDMAQVIESYSYSMSNNIPVTMEFRMLDKQTKRTKHILGKVDFIFDNKGNAVRLEGTLQDITKIKLAAEELKKLNEQLNKRAEELAISNKELEQFAYVASHDLQEPLRMVTSFLTQIEKKYNDILDEKGRKYIFLAVDGAVRMRKIILDLLEYSRAGRMEYELEVIDMNELLQQVVSMNQTIIGEKDAVIQWQDLPTITAGRTPVQLLFQNLISNSLKYQKPDRKPVIRISTSETSGYWEFHVADNGIGIAPMFYEKIFLLFQRLHNKDEYTGTGIGLTVCKKIVEKHKGSIWLESTEGEGTTFHFTIAKNLKA
jgi:PAS domain S-box-containing protein